MVDTGQSLWYGGVMYTNLCSVFPHTAIETFRIDGRYYILALEDRDVEVNGMKISM